MQFNIYTSLIDYHLLRFRSHQWCNGYVDHRSSSISIWVTSILHGDTLTRARSLASISNGELVRDYARPRLRSLELPSPPPQPPPSSVPWLLLRSLLNPHRPFPTSCTSCQSVPGGPVEPGGGGVGAGGTGCNPPARISC